MIRCFTGMLVLLLLAASFPSGMATAAGKTAKNLTADCTFRVSSNAEEKELLRDGDHGTAWIAAKDSEQWVEIALPEDQTTAGLYIMWNVVPKNWSLETLSEDGDWREVAVGVKSNFINSYITLGPGLKKLRINTVKGWKCSISEIAIYGPGYLPEDVQVWLPPPEKADLMVIPAHPDDEHIYFGGTLPYYAGQLKKHTVVVYMTSSPMIRKFEALDGLWKVGVREYPVFLPLANKYTSTVEEAELAWDGLENTVGLLVEQFRRFRPDVVITHDLDGEYGHGAHKLTALAVTKAIKASSDSDKCTESVTEYGIWDLRKCYLHLYAKHKIKMDWRVPLPAFNGKTALQMARDGYDLHVSQHFRERPIQDSGEYDNSRYGLYYSSVGPDTGMNDFFENVIALPTRSPTPSPTPTPLPIAIDLTTQAPDPSPDSAEAIASIPKGMRVTVDNDMAIRIFLSFGAIAFLTAVLISYRRSQGAEPARRKQHRKCLRPHGKEAG